MKKLVFLLSVAIVSTVFCMDQTKRSQVLYSDMPASTHRILPYIHMLMQKQSAELGNLTKQFVVGSAKQKGINFYHSRLYNDHLFIRSSLNNVAIHISKLTEAIKRPHCRRAAAENDILMGERPIHMLYEQKKKRHVRAKSLPSKWNNHHAVNQPKLHRRKSR